ncbi:MAG: class III signal peptide-containing protein [Halobacteriovoraceae bacterium]|jgi:hypothetical protein|nr:class III signal peptide-containing protein [Halobacteriovoraceae bacterium]
MGYFYKLNQKGQSAVEYILLIAVVVSIVTFVFKTEAFKGLFGDNGQFADVYKRELEYSFRHALGDRKPFRTPNYRSGQHDSYNGRFFGSKDAYPLQ